MRRMMPIALIGAGILLLSTVRPSSAQSLIASNVVPVKFVCGRQAPNFDLRAPEEPPVKPGNYATVINIENLTSNSDTGAGIAVAIRSIVSVAGATSPVPGPSITGLGQFATADITCADIAKAVGSSNGFITGFVNLIPIGPAVSITPAVAVTAVYTSQGCNFPILSTLVPALPTCSGPVSTKVVPFGTLAVRTANPS